MFLPKAICILLFPRMLVNQGGGICEREQPFLVCGEFRQKRWRRIGRQDLPPVVLKPKIQKVPIVTITAKDPQSDLERFFFQTCNSR